MRTEPAPALTTSTARPPRSSLSQQTSVSDSTPSTLARLPVLITKRSLHFGPSSDHAIAPAPATRWQEAGPSADVSGMRTVTVASDPPETLQSSFATCVRARLPYMEDVHAG